MRDYQADLCEGYVVIASRCWWDECFPEAQSVIDRVESSFSTDIQRWNECAGGIFVTRITIATISENVGLDLLL